MDTRGLSRVRSEIGAAAACAGVSVDGISLVAVSKGRSNDEVMHIANAGQRLFGENRQQELAERTSCVFPDGTQWQFIGPLQSRKVPFVERNVSLLQSMDRPSLASKWVGAGKTPVLLQFNVGLEPQKSGFAPSAADETIDVMLEIGLDVIGVMAIPPISDDPDATRPYFRRLRAIFDRYRGRYEGIEHCSMGMSNDYRAAVAEGATLLRLGTVLFGERGA